MKKLLMLISFLLMGLIAFSQTDTSTNKKCFPTPVVRMIVKDLLSGDSAKAQLQLTEKQLEETEKKVMLKDSVITTLRSKETNYQTIITAEKEKFQIQQEYTKKLEKDLRKEKTKSKFKSAIYIGSLVVLTILFNNR